MRIIIRADRKIGKEIIAEHRFRGTRIIDRIVNFLLDIGENKIQIVSDEDLKVKNVENIPLSKIDLLKSKIVIDLKFVYDDRKLRRLIKKGKSVEKAVMIENKTIKNLDSFGCLYERKEWNPISQFYIEPLGEKIAFWLRKTKVTPNFVTSLNITLGALASVLIFLGGTLNLVLFGIWVRIYHLLDVMDGSLSKFKGQGTLFGKWFDCVGDRFINGVWYLVIILTLYLRSRNTLYLFVGLALLFGVYMYNHLLLTSVAYFRNNNFYYKSPTKIKENILIKFVLLFINGDIHFHLLTIFSFMNKLEWFVLFYTGYFNFMWLMYFIFYLVKYVKEGDIKETQF